MPKIIYHDSDDVDRILSLGSEPVLVGRATECQVRTEDARVSRKHARIFTQEGAFWIEDLGSANGVYVGEDRVERAPLRLGEVATCGTLVLRLVPDDAVITPRAGAPTADASEDLLRARVLEWSTTHVGSRPVSRLDPEASERVTAGPSAEPDPIGFVDDTHDEFERIGLMAAEEERDRLLARVRVLETQLARTSPPESASSRQVVAEGQAALLEVQRALNALKLEAKRLNVFSELSPALRAAENALSRATDLVGSLKA